MFQKRCARVYKGKTYESWWAVEAYREKGKVKHRYVMNITNYSPSQRERIIKILNNPEACLIEDMEDFFQKGIDYGQIVFFLYQMKELGITELLSKNLSKKTVALIVAVLLNRIIKPASKMEAIQWVKDTAFVHFSSLKEKDYSANRVYEAMDEVYDNLEDIMEDFYSLSGGKPIFLLYDITSVYFEGRKVKRAKNGYSRDRRPDRPQVLLGIVLNEKGFPVHFQVFDGNLRDSQTVEGVVKKVKKRFEIEKAIFVGDRGMITVDNIEEITSKGLGYIMALKHEAAKDLLIEKGIQLELFDQRLPIKIHQEDGKKYVLCGSEYRKERDLSVFRALLKKGREALEVVKRMVDKGRLKEYDKVIRRAQRKLTESGASRYYDFQYRDGKFRTIEKDEEIKRGESLCGYYILETSEVGLEDEKVEEHYKGLQEVERVFRDLKDLIDIRPVYHWIDRRVETHIFLCLLAQVVLGKVRRKLKEGGWLGKKKENTLENFINRLDTIKMGEFIIEERRIFRVQRENPLHDVLLRIFGIHQFEFGRDKEACSI